MSIFKTREAEILACVRWIQHQNSTLLRQQEWFSEQLNRIERNQKQTMLDLTKLTADVAALTSVEQSAVALLTALKAAVDAIPTSNDPATQAALDALSSQIESGSADLAAAVVKNTPAAPPA